MRLRRRWWIIGAGPQRQQETVTPSDEFAEVMRIESLGCHHSERPDLEGLDFERREQLAIGDDADALRDDAWPLGNKGDVHTQFAAGRHDGGLNGR